MNTKTKIVTMLFALFSLIVFNASSGGRNTINYPDGCNGCHSSNAMSGGIGSMLLTPATDCVVLGETTSMTLCTSDANAVVGGFNINASAGTFIPGNGSRLGASGSWLTHNTPQAFAGGQTCWTFAYTAPLTAVDITFQYSGIGANGNGGNGAGDDTYFGTIDLEVKNALPISMSSFELKNDQDKRVVINWQTESETNNEYFIVERSTDGRSFEGLVDIEGNGNSTSSHSYSFVDENPILNQTMYYRIQQVDFDGSAAISDVLSIELSILDIQVQSMYPIPLPLNQPLNLDFTLPYDTNVELNVISSDGKVIEQVEIDGLAGTNELKLDLNGITSKGLYYLVIGNELFKTQAKPFVVK